MSHSERLSSFFNGMSTALVDFQRQMSETREKIMATLASIQANDEVRLSGLEGRLYVRAGMHPAYATPDDLQRLLDDIMVRPMMVTGETLDAHLSTASRARLAAAAMRGWATHRGSTVTDTLMPWHRLIGTTAVSVGHAA